MPSTTGTSNASLSLLARFLSIGLDSTAVARYRLEPGETQILSFTKADLSRHFSPRCVEVLDQVQEDGDRLEWYGIVVEAVVADGLHLEMEWTHDASAETRVSFQKEAKKALSPRGDQGGKTPSPRGDQGGKTPSGGQVDVGATAGEENRTVIDAPGRVVLGYRVRPLERRVSAADPRTPPGPRLASLPSPRQVSGQGQAGPREEPSPESLLRGAFLDDGKETGKVVGRLGLLLVEGDGTRQVGLDHAFQSGDRFRFEVTSGVRGWLYVLHGPPDGEAQVLWPRDGAASLVEAQVVSVIPPSPQAFAFDKAVGEESFYVAIRSAPNPGSALRSRPEPVAEDEVRREVQYVVRGLEKPGRRGVFFDPGGQDGDLHVYFAPSEGDDGTVAVVEFQLRHE